MKIGKDKLKMSSGEVRKFGSEKKRNNFERVAQAYNHGWDPKQNPVKSPTLVGADQAQITHFYKREKK